MENVSDMVLLRAEKMTNNQILEYAGSCLDISNHNIDRAMELSKEIDNALILVSKLMEKRKDFEKVAEMFSNMAKEYMLVVENRKDI